MKVTTLRHLKSLQFDLDRIYLQYLGELLNLACLLATRFHRESDYFTSSYNTWNFKNAKLAYNKVVFSILCQDLNVKSQKQLLFFIVQCT